MIPTQIKQLLSLQGDGRTVTVCGWVRTVRDSKNMVFIQVNDGSCMPSIQLTFDRAALKGGVDAADNASNVSISNVSNASNIEESLKDISTGASIRAEGTLVESPATGQKVEVLIRNITVLGKCPPDKYPLQKKRMTMEYLRDSAHLRARTNTFGAVFRMRNALSYALHTFFQERGFIWLAAPEITCSDAEGAGEMFQVTTLSLEKIAELGVKAGAGGMKVEDAHKIIDYKKDFFCRKASLTVSGQLEGEAFATAMGRIYTFGPTFRAENSNTPRHLAEFWMCEPEMAFFDNDDNMDLEEEFLKYLLSKALECKDDMAFFDERIQKGVIKQLEGVVQSSFKRISYTDAVEILRENNSRFEYPIEWGRELQTEHERFLTEEIFHAPVMVYDYPKDIKAFYMKQNDDGKTVRAVDVLVPGLGEITGGSQREDDYEKLLSACNERKMDMSAYEWYMDLRRFGSVPHSGFGLGFDRLLRYVTGMVNIRDVVPFPRAPGLAEF